MEVFLIHGSCKTIFRKHDRCDKYNFYFFSLTKRRRQRGLCATVRFSWLNFSSKITLYQAYFPNHFKISAAIISTISSFIFTHIQPTIMTKYFFKQLLFPAQPSHPLQTHLLALSHIQTLLPLFIHTFSSLTSVHTHILFSYLCSYTHSLLLPLFIHTFSSLTSVHTHILFSYLCSYTHSLLLPLFIHTTLLSYLCS